MFDLDAQSLADLQRLAGLRIETVAVEPYALRCTLSGGASLSCAGRATLGAVTVNFHKGDAPKLSAALAGRLEGRVIVVIAAGEANGLHLTLDDGSVLQLDGSSREYEAYEITIDEKTVIV